MRSVITVTAPATSHDLTTVAALKAELGITGNADDANLATWITQASRAAEAYCNRVFVSEGVKETFRNRQGLRLDAICLDRNPVTSIISMTEDGEPLIEDVDFELDPAEGIIYRLASSRARCWNFTSIVVDYIGGFTADTMPITLSRGVMTLVKLLRSSATRDPALRSENILSGLYSYTLFGANEMPNGLPGDVEALWSSYRNISV